MELNKYRKSKQRQKILGLLKSTTKHPTASWIYEKLKPEFPSLSLGNVYRNLKILVELGCVQELKFGSTFDRYDGNVNPHYHLICENCGQIKDIEMRQETALDRKVEELTDFRVRNHRLEFFGLCEACVPSNGNGKAWHEPVFSAEEYE